MALLDFLAPSVFKRALLLATNASLVRILQQTASSPLCPIKIIFLIFYLSFILAPKMILPTNRFVGDLPIYQRLLLSAKKLHQINDPIQAYLRILKSTYPPLELQSVLPCRLHHLFLVKFFNTPSCSYSIVLRKKPHSLVNYPYKV